MTMKLYMHPVSTATRPVRLLIAENGIKCDEEMVDILKGALCVPKTLSALMRWQNRLSWRNDWAAVFIPCFRGHAFQVAEPA